MKALIANMSVMRKLGAIMGIATIVLIIETTIFLIATQNLGKSFEAFEHNSFDGVKTVLETEKELNYFSRLTREIMLGGNLEENLDKLDKTHAKIEKLFHHLQNSISSSEQENFYKHAQHDSMVFITSSRDLMHTIQKDKTDLQAVYHLYHKEFSPIAKASRHSMEKLVDSKMSEAAKMKQGFKEELIHWSIIAGVTGVVGLATMIIVMFLIVSQIQGALHTVQNGLHSFFSFLAGESERAESIPTLGKDEFGTMGSMINANIAQLEAKIIEQKQAINDFQIVCSDAAQGHLHHRITTHYHDANLVNLSRTLNALLDEIHNVFSTLTAMQVDFAQGNYANAANRAIATKGSFASLQQTVLTVAQSNSEIFSLIAKFSREFTTDASHLNTTGEELSTSANEQASSLEETAAAIEELTSNVASNVAKTEHMAKSAQEAKTTAEKGNSVAKESLNAMNEIVSATEAIHQAVDIINNIAFQTNILSLNAAVEAATAGEAGKGFAVVAQEVRNLANRSADAAAQIQELAQAAREKSRAGLDTSKHMMESFTTISQKIDQTNEMVRDVANASHEQMSGINQINGAITQLDQMTQQNAKTANNVAIISNEILEKTQTFEHILTRVAYEKSADQQNCDVGLIFDTAKLKIDHINFKENTYNKLKSETTSWKVTSHHECNLGKWIGEHASSPFAQTAEWNMLLKHHEDVHKGVQNYIDSYVANAPMETMESISRELETATLGVFKGLDHVKTSKCKG